MRFANWLCDCGQGIALSGPRASHAGTELVGEKWHLASGSRTTLSSSRDGAWPGMNALALAARALFGGDWGASPALAGTGRVVSSNVDPGQGWWGESSSMAIDPG